MAQKLQVDIISRELVKPSSPTVDRNKPFKFPLFSQLTPTTYSPIIFFYPSAASPSSHNNISQTILYLKKTLSQTLTLYYPFSGRVVDNIFIHHFNEGVPFFVARVTGSVLSDFLKNPRVELLNGFLPYNPFVKETEAGVPPMAFQVTVFSCGGVVIGWSASHKLIDAPTGSVFMHAWATISRTGSIGNVIKPNCDEPSIYFPPRNPFPEKYLSLMESLWFTAGNYISKRFVFDAKSIISLREKARGEGNEKNKKKMPSRLEALSCFIWKCSMAASTAVSGTPKASILVQAVNLRTRTKPPMSNVSIGDIFWWATAVADPSLKNKELHELTTLLDEAIALYDSDYMDSLQGDDGFGTMSDYCNQLIELCSSEKPDIFAFSSWCHLGIYNIDFGFGKPLWIGSLGKAGPEFRNLTLFIETRDGKGIEAWITLNEERMAQLERDPEFLAYCSPNPRLSSL